MPVAGIVTLIAVALVVAALAIYLITVAWLLQRVSFNLGTIIAGLRSIAFQTESLGQRFHRINGSLGASHQTLQRFVEELRRQEPQAVPTTPNEESGPGTTAVAGPGTSAEAGPGTTAEDSGGTPASGPTGRRKAGRRTTGLR